MTDGEKLVNNIINYVKSHLENKDKTDKAIKLCLDKLKVEAQRGEVRYNTRGDILLSTSFVLILEETLSSVFTRRH